MHQEVTPVASGGATGGETDVEVGAGGVSWLGFLVFKAGNSREVELGMKLRGGVVVPFEDEAPAMEMLESRMGKAASQWV